MCKLFVLQVELGFVFDFIFDCEDGVVVGQEVVYVVFVVDLFGSVENCFGCVGVCIYDFFYLYWCDDVCIVLCVLCVFVYIMLLKVVNVVDVVEMIVFIEGICCEFGIVQLILVDVLIEMYGVFVQVVVFVVLLMVGMLSFGLMDFVFVYYGVIFDFVMCLFGQFDYLFVCCVKLEIVVVCYVYGKMLLYNVMIEVCDMSVVVGDVCCVCDEFVFMWMWSIYFVQICLIVDVFVLCIDEVMLVVEILLVVQVVDWGLMCYGDMLYDCVSYCYYWLVLCCVQVIG